MCKEPQYIHIYSKNLVYPKIHGSIVINIAQILEYKVYNKGLRLFVKYQLMLAMRLGCHLGGFASRFRNTCA